MHVCIHVSETQHNVQEGHSKIRHKLDFCSPFGSVKSGSAYTFFVSRITLLLLGHCMKEFEGPTIISFANNKFSVQLLFLTDMCVRVSEKERYACRHDFEWDKKERRMAS